MSIAHICTQCGAGLSFADDKASLRVPCPYCATENLLPGAAELIAKNEQARNQAELERQRMEMEAELRREQLEIEAETERERARLEAANEQRRMADQRRKERSNSRRAWVSWAVSAAVSVIIAGIVLITSMGGVLAGVATQLGLPDIPAMVGLGPPEMPEPDEAIEPDSTKNTKAKRAVTTSSSSSSSSTNKTTTRSTRSKTSTKSRSSKKTVRRGAR